MFDWLKKSGGSKPWKNGVGLETESLALLAEAFAPLEKISPDLPAEVVRYLLDGEGEEVLTRLAGTDGAGEALALGWRAILPGKAPHTVAREKFFESVACKDSRFFIRLGKTYEAASSSRSSKQPAPLLNISTVPKQPAFGDPSLKWLEILLLVGTRLTLNTFPRQCHPCPALNAELIEAMLAAEGHAPDLLIRAAFQPQLDRFGGPLFERIFATLGGLAGSAVRHKSALLEALNHADFKQRVYAIEMMKKCNVPSEPFAEKLVDLAVESSKQVREQVEALLAGIAPAVRPLLEQKVRTGENEERPYAARLLWKWEGEEARAFLSGRLTQEKNKKVLQAFQELIATPAPPSSQDEGEVLRLADLPPVPEHLPLGRETEQAWRECFGKINGAIERQRAEKLLRQQRTNLSPVAEDVIGKGFRGLQGPDHAEALLGELFRAWYSNEISDALKAFWQRPELEPVHLVRFAIQIGILKSDRSVQPAYIFWFERLFSYYRRGHPSVGLRELGAVFTALGLDARQIGDGVLRRQFR